MLCIHGSFGSFFLYRNKKKERMQHLYKKCCKISRQHNNMQKEELAL